MESGLSSIHAATIILEELILELGVKKQGHVALTGDTIVVSNAAQRGAMSLSMMVELAGIVVKLQETTPGLVWLRGTQNSFCSGGNLREVRTGLYDPDAGKNMCRAMTVVLDELRRLPTLSIAVVDGPALGGGAELLTAVDLRVATAQAKVGFVHSTLGVSPGWGGATRLAQIVGRQRSLRWLLTGEVLSGEALVKTGFVDFYADTIEEALKEVGAHITKPDAVLQAIKASLGSWDRPSDHECRAFGSVWGAEAHQRALGLSQT